MIECVACDSGGKCPTGEKKAIRFCPGCKLKLNQHAPKLCPNCKLDLMAWLWGEGDRLTRQPTQPQTLKRLLGAIKTIVNDPSTDTIWIDESCTLVDELCIVAKMNGATDEQIEEAITP